MSKTRVIPNLVVTFALTFVLASANAEPFELIIRTQKNAHVRALANIVGLTQAPTETHQSNSNQKIIRLNFTSAQKLEEAREALVEQYPHVERNHYYRPSINFFPVFAKTRSSSGGNPLTFSPGKTIDLLKAIADLPDVTFPGQFMQGPDPFLESDWAYRAIRMPSDDMIVAALKDKKPITTALIDTGIDYNHEDLSGSLWRSPADPNLIGWDVIHQHSRPYDVVHFDIEGCIKDSQCKNFIQTSRFLVNPGHGTHCAGHIGAVANNSRGIRGMANGAARIMTLKFIYGNSEGPVGNVGEGDDVSIVESIDWAIQHGAKIINMSWGGRQPRVEAEHSEFKRALQRARDAGILVVAAAGNDAINLDSDNLPSYPAAYDLDNLIVVAAMDRTGKLAEFSSYGPRTVHLAAPGVKILSTIPGNNYSSTVARFVDETGKVRELSWDGTSMAAPLVTGAAALIWASHPQESYRQIRKRIFQNVRPIAELQGKVQSGGVLDVGRAMK